MHWQSPGFAVKFRRKEEMLTQADRPGEGGNKTAGHARATRRRDKQPGWVQGLRQIYNSVLEEPLPPSFDSLLKKLDDEDGSRG